MLLLQDATIRDRENSVDSVCLICSSQRAPHHAQLLSSRTAFDDVTLPRDGSSRVSSDVTRGRTQLAAAVRDGAAG